MPIFAKSDGVTLHDRDGRVYLDAEAANGSAVLGYDRTLLEAACSRASSLPGLPSFCESELRLEVAQRLAALVDQAAGVRGRICFDLGGAQGIELALKIARRARPSGALLAFEGAYHGRSLFTAQLSASRRYRTTLPFGEVIERLPYPGCERCRFGREPSTCDVECGRYVRTRLNEDFGGLRSGLGDDISAFIFEPILNVGGMVTPDPRYLRACIDAVRQKGGLIIADEVFTGMHRTGPLFGFQRFGITPDVVVVSKGLTNGLSPLACVWAREPLGAPAGFPPGTHSSTYLNGPLALAVAAEVLERFSRLNVAQMVARLAAELARQVATLAGSPLVADTAVWGGIAKLRLTRPIASEVRSLALSTGAEGANRYAGLLVASTGMSDDTVALHPALTSTPAEIGDMFTLLRNTLARAAELQEA